MTNIRKKQKPLSESATHTITWVDQFGNQQQFKSSEKLLKSHKLLMQNNPYVKEMKIKKGI